MNTELNQQVVQAPKRLSILICARAGVSGSRADNRARSPTGEHSSAVAVEEEARGVSASWQRATTSHPADDGGWWL